MPRHPEWMESLYERLAEDDEGRVCAAISEAACRESPGNFFRTLLANTLSSLADRLASAKTTLPWLLLQLGAPGWMLSLLVPIRESGSMLPQMLIGAVVRRQPVRKWVWVWGGVLQGLCLLAMGWAALALQGAPAGAAVVGLLVLFSLARGACSVAYKDVQGKTIPKTRRGRLSGWISALSGLAALGVGLALGGLQGEGSPVLFAGLLVGGALLWLAAAAVFGRIVEQPGATEGGRTASWRPSPASPCCATIAPFAHSSLRARSPWAPASRRPSTWRWRGRSWVMRSPCSACSSPSRDWPGC